MNMQEHMHEQSSTAQEKTPMLVFIGVGLLSIAVIAVTVFRVSFSSVVFYGAILACPLMHILMMRGMTHGESHKR